MSKKQNLGTSNRAQEGPRSVYDNWMLDLAEIRDESRLSAADVAKGIRKFAYDQIIQEGGSVEAAMQAANRLADWGAENLEVSPGGEATFRKADEVDKPRLP